MSRKEQIYTEIIDNKIKQVNMAHPYTGNKKEIFYVEKFVEDLNRSFSKFEILKIEGKIIHAKICNEYVYFHIDHVDNGGNKKGSKKVSIEYSKKKIINLIKNEHKVIFVNFYFNLKNDLTVDKNKYTYIFIDPTTVEQSMVAKKIFGNNLEKINSSSRWIGLSKILDFQESGIRYTEITKDKNNTKEKYLWLVSKFGLSSFFREYLFSKLNIVLNSRDYIYPEIFSDIEKLDDLSNITKTEKEYLLKIRCGQGAFRDNLSTIYKSKCILTGCDNEVFLIASHIKPWSKSNAQERLDWRNGLFIHTSVDKLFDKFLISFDENGYFVHNKSLNEKDLSYSNIMKEILSREISIWDLVKDHNKSKEYFSYHYKEFELTNKKP